MKEEKLNYLKNLTLLLVEDDDELLNKLKTILSIFFKDVICAKDGHDAYKIFTTSTIDMLITDYVMPNMNGYELCKIIRNKNKNIPLVIMSNYSDKEKLLNVIPLSLAQYLVKPVSYVTLTQTLVSMVEKLEDISYTEYLLSPTLNYDRTKKELKNESGLIPLSKSEIVIIELFIENKNKIIATTDIEFSLDPKEDKSSQAIKSLIYRLRKKIGKNIIINIPSYGYMYKTT
ncbi:MAG: DNA-binding response OmpR family regulator [Sulfurimonas sp.]|jgi:DNA-binding response OmpR family regulator|uniref:response regulator transcription factor n=1 Tax=Sulfurimonas sp. TaxID=2022749 RepID=UPI0039E5F17E